MNFYALYLIFVLSFLGAVEGLNGSQAGPAISLKKDKHERVKVSWNGQCEEFEEFNATSVFYSHFDEGNTTLHYYISSIGTPAVLVVVTELGAEVAIINCSALYNAQPAHMKDFIQFSPPPLFAYGFLFNKLISYNDVNDNADLQHADEMYSVGLRNLSWEAFVQNFNGSSDTVTLKASTSTSELNFLEGGSINLKFVLHEDSSRMKELPHLLYNQGTLGIDFTLDRLSVPTDSTRYALEMVMVTSQQANEGRNMRLKVIKTVDDEYTPGVFKLLEWVSDELEHQNKSYLQWKPVCYTTAHHDTKQATQAKYYSLMSSSDAAQQRSIALAYFGDAMYDASNLVSATNVSFGFKQDKFYQHTNYTVWSATLGYGVPPEETISWVIFLALCVGLGIPIITIVLGSVWLCVNKYSRRRYNNYQPIQ